MGFEQDLSNLMVLVTISVSIGVFIGLMAWSLLFALFTSLLRLGRRFLSAVNSGYINKIGGCDPHLQEGVKRHSQDGSIVGGER